VEQGEGAESWRAEIGGEGRVLAGWSLSEKEERERRGVLVMSAVDRAVQQPTYWK
jgi:hypothetical protein